MRRIFLLLLLCPLFSLGQKLNVFTPDGKRINFREGASIRNILDSLGEAETSSYSDAQYDAVFFKRLSTKPIMAITSNPAKIPGLIASYKKKYYSYLNDHSYYFDLKDMMKSGTLTQEYLIGVFGEPTAKVPNEDGSESWIFKKYNAKVDFSEKVAKAVDVVNYRDIEKNQLAIGYYNVTGTDNTIGFETSLHNYGDKTIKYAYITVTAKNPVQDKIGTKTLQAIGPIKPGKGGSYSFETVFYSRAAKYLFMENIKIQYMDGTVKIIPKAAINDIKIRDWEEEGSRTLDDE